MNIDEKNYQISVEQMKKEMLLALEALQSTFEKNITHFETKYPFLKVDGVNLFRTTIEATSHTQLKCILTLAASIS